METNKKIFVTGATGFIGSALVSSLVNEGYTVHALIRSRKKADDLLPKSNVFLFEGDVTDMDSLQKGMEGCHDIYHLGSFVDVWHPDKKKPYEINVTGTSNVIEAGNRVGSERMLFVSTAGVWGPSEEKTVTENTEITNLPLTDYERSKKEAEDLIHSCTAEKLKIVIVNPTRVFGPGPLIKSNVTTYFGKYIRGKFRFLPGSGNQVANYVYINDLIEGMKQAIERGKHGENYILGGENATFNELFASIGRISGKNYGMIPIPAALILFFSYFEQWKADIFGLKPLITPGFARKYSKHWKISSEKAQKHLGYEIRPLNEALLETVEWLKSNHLNNT